MKFKVILEIDKWLKNKDKKDLKILDRLFTKEDQYKIFYLFLYKDFNTSNKFINYRFGRKSLECKFNLCLKQVDPEHELIFDTIHFEKRLRRNISIFYYYIDRFSDNYKSGSISFYK